MALDPRILSLARAVRDAGGRALLVGGWVRELVARRLSGASSPPAREYDLEVYGLPAERLTPILGRFGEVKLVGQAFAVYKLFITGAGGEEMPPDSTSACRVATPRSPPGTAASR